MPIPLFLTFTIEEPSSHYEESLVYDLTGALLHCSIAA